MHGNADFYVFIICEFLHCVYFFGLSTCKIMLSAKFDFLFPIGGLLFFLPHCSALSAPALYLNRGTSLYSCFLVLEEKLSSFSPLSMMFAVGLSYRPCSCRATIFLSPTLLRLFNMKELNFDQSFFWIYSDDFFGLSYQSVCVETFLHSKNNVIMMILLLKCCWTELHFFIWKCFFFWGVEIGIKLGISHLPGGNPLPVGAFSHLTY